MILRIGKILLQHYDERIRVIFVNMYNLFGLKHKFQINYRKYIATILRVIMQSQENH